MDRQAPTVSAADFPICCDDPVGRCARPPAPADIIIDRPDRLSSIVPRISEQKSADKKQKGGYAARGVIWTA